MIEKPLLEKPTIITKNDYYGDKKNFELYFKQDVVNALKRFKKIINYIETNNNFLLEKVNYQRKFESLYKQVVELNHKFDDIFGEIK